MLTTNLQPTIIPTIDIRIRNTYPLEKIALGFCLGDFVGSFLELCEINQSKREKNRSKRSLILIPNLESVVKQN